MLSTHSLPFLLASLWLGVVVPVWVKSRRQIDQFKKYSYPVGIPDDI